MPTAVPLPSSRTTRPLQSRQRARGAWHDRRGPRRVSRRRLCAPQYAEAPTTSATCSRCSASPTRPSSPIAAPLPLNKITRRRTALWPPPLPGIGKLDEAAVLFFGHAIAINPNITPLAQQFGRRTRGTWQVWRPWSPIATPSPSGRITRRRTTISATRLRRSASRTRPSPPITGPLPSSRITPRRTAAEPEPAFSSGTCARDRRVSVALEGRHFPEKIRLCLARFWEGENLAGKAILVHCEQGYGDSIHFIRYVAPLSRMAERVAVYTDQPLANLFR